MRVDAVGYLQKAQDAGPQSAAAERLGYDGWWAPETQADVFISCAVAALGTERIRIHTGIAVAFARNPMSIAYQANDLQLLSGGRFTLGLGSQVKPHITRRFSMEYSRPAARMREYILAMRAIWRAWETNERLDFRGEFYTHTLMTPFFDPGPNPHGNPQVLLAAVGPLMTEVAGEVADGVVCHGFSTERYLREVTLPALRRGAAKADRDLDGFEINAPGFVVAADTEEEMAAGIAEVRRQVGFYGSTPAYRGVLELHGWGGLGDELTELSKRGDWGGLSTLIDEEMLHTFAVIGTPDEVVAELKRRYGDVATRVLLPVPAGADPERWQPVVEALRETEPTRLAQ
jgi:probable F420-dependent oxidoreductase